jgi:hypothetical protein
MIINFGFRSLILSLLLLAFCQSLFTQQINIKLQTVDSLNISNTTNLVYDVNGEVCNLVIVRTEIDSLKFYSNRGTERIEKQAGEYRIWISPATTILRISVPGLPLYELLLPGSAFPNSVYFINMSTIVRENIVYKDTVSVEPFLSVSSEPSGATVYINKKYAGRTPFVSEKPLEPFINYKLIKSGYRICWGADTLDPGVNSINIKLEDLRYTRRWFLTCSGYVISSSFANHNYDDFDAVYGITLGKIGKTSWYSALKYNRSEPVKRWDPDNPLTGVHSTYPYTVKKLQLTAGLTQQITKSFFIMGGGGYSENQNGAVNGYYVDDKFYLTTIDDYSFNGFNTDIGIMTRVLWFLVFSGNISLDFAISERKIEYKGSVYGAGVGINFGIKRREDK